MVMLQLASNRFCLRRPLCWPYMTHSAESLCHAILAPGAPQSCVWVAIRGGYCPLLLCPSIVLLWPKRHKSKTKLGTLPKSATSGTHNHFANASGRIIPRPRAPDTPAMIGIRDAFLLLTIQRRAIAAFAIVTVPATVNNISDISNRMESTGFSEEIISSLS